MRWLIESPSPRPFADAEMNGSKMSAERPSGMPAPLSLNANRTLLGSERFERGLTQLETRSVPPFFLIASRAFMMRLRKTSRSMLASTFSFGSSSSRSVTSSIPADSSDSRASASDSPRMRWTWQSRRRGAGGRA